MCAPRFLPPLLRFPAHCEMCTSRHYTNNGYERICDTQVSKRAKAYAPGYALASSLLVYPSAATDSIGCVLPLGVGYSVTELPLSRFVCFLHPCSFPFFS